MISKKFYDKKVAFIGSGNMAEAIISGFVKYDIINRANMYVTIFLRKDFSLYLTNMLCQSNRIKQKL
jgi:pyrroline-5-carboxylate reductase